MMWCDSTTNYGSEQPVTDIRIVDQNADTPFTETQFEAARFFVARLRAEASREKFDGEEIGMTFVPMGDYPAASLDTGMMISTTDFIRAALLMLWSLILDMAEGAGVSPAQVIQQMGLSLAENNPA